MAVLWGKACQRHATSPATRGVENEVPMSLTIVPRPEMSEVGLPKAITSGLTRPSCVGPTPLKGAFIKLVFTAPTVRMSLASAGKHLLGKLLAAFLSEDIITVLRQLGRGEPRHILDESEDGHVDLFVAIHIDTLAGIGESYLLRC